MLKDHYRILELAPGASADEIRRSYRRLAMAYHPDRHGEDAVSAAHFREIKESYETLSDPRRKDAYLQERWYERSMGRGLAASEPLTAAGILRDTIALERMIASLDPFRIDTAGLLRHIGGMLQTESISILKEEKDPAVAATVGQLLLKCGRNFRLREAQELASLLEQLFPDGHPGHASIQTYLSRKRKEAAWERWRVPILLAGTLLLCLVIYLAGR